MHDVIIIGAGPSGSSCAYHIKKILPTASVLLIDKAQFPRYKPCGGGISPDVKNYLDFDFDDVVSFHCRDVLLTAKQKSTKSSCDIIMVRRESFDDFLAGKALDAGVSVLMNTEVIDIIQTKSHAEIKTKEGTYTTKIVVLAEGGAGKLARQLAIAPKNNVAAALEYEHPIETHDGLLHVNFDYNRSGYAWIFPKADGLSMGIGKFSDGKIKEPVGLPQQLKNYLHDSAVKNIERDRQHGHPVQLYSGRKKLVFNRVLLIGEIAGCVDPLTAEGIRPAIKSGYLAAPIICDALKKNKINTLKQYNKIFHQEIGRDFRYAKRVANLLFRYYDKMLPMLCTPRAAKSFASVFSGEKKYSDFVGIRMIMRLIKRFFMRENINS